MSPSPTRAAVRSTSYAMAIGHCDGEVAVVDAVRERKPPFSPEAVTDEYCELLKAYGVQEIVTDRYAGEWPREQFHKRGIEHKLAEKTASDFFGAMVPALNSQRVALIG